MDNVLHGISFMYFDLTSGRLFFVLSSLEPPRPALYIVVTYGSVFLRGWLVANHSSGIGPIIQSQHRWSVHNVLVLDNKK